MHLLAFILTSLGVIFGAGTRAGCPSLCRCEVDGSLWRVSCVDAGLSVIPSNLSGLTSYLDLSMNKVSRLPDYAFRNLHALQELRLAGNGLTDLPRDIFAGLVNLRVLMLQNNHLKHFPSGAMQNLRHLQSLRLDANFIACLPPSSFKGLTSLRHLWLDDNVLTEVPVVALASVPTLQAVTLALNNITHIPDGAFGSLSQLVVLHLHDNQIHSLGQRCFDGLYNLETLDLSSNSLDSFPAAIRSLSSLRELNLHSNNIKAIPEYSFVGNPSLETINIQNNPVHTVGRSAFQQLPELRTLYLSGTSGITEFPDLRETNRLETLSITGTHISTTPSTICEELPNLHKLDLSHNLIQSLPSFSSCRKLQNIDLHHNSIHNVHPDTFRQMKDLRSLDLTSNQISSISLEDLQSLTHLKLAGNLELRARLPLHQLPRLRVAEMPFAFQCCEFLHCGKSKSPKSWNPNPADSIRKKKNKSPDNLTMDFSVKMRPQPAVRCSPTPGPSQTCQNPFVPRFMQLSVRFIFILSVAFNFLVLVSIFLSSASKPPSQHLLGVLFWLRFLSGFSGGTMDVRDAVIMDCCGAFGPSKETEAGSGVTGFLFTLSSQACVFLTVAFVFQHKHLSFDLNLPKAWRNLQVTFAACCTLALAVTALPLIISLFLPCVSSSQRHSPCWGYSTALVVFNALCYTFMTVTHAFHDCHRVTLRPKGLQDIATTRMMTFLLVTNTVLFLSATLLSFSSLLPHSSLPDAQVDKSTVLLIVTALPACLDPLLYMFFSLHFREDLLHCLQKKLNRLNSGKDTQRASVNSEDADKQPCQPVEIVVSVSL